VSGGGETALSPQPEFVVFLAELQIASQERVAEAVAKLS
jgi:hypothetical protein